MLLAVHLQRIREDLGIGGGQGTELGQAELEQQLTPLGADAADLAEVALHGRLLIAEASPGAEHALLAVAHQRWRRGALQVGRHFGQGLIQLAQQSIPEHQPLPLEPPGACRHHQAMADRPLLPPREQLPP